MYSQRLSDSAKTLISALIQQRQGFNGHHVSALVPRFCRAIEFAGEGALRPSKVPVALLLPLGLNLAAAEFAVLHQKRFFLPIDPTHPIQRIEAIVRDSSADVILVDQTTRHLAEQLPCSRIVDLSSETLDPIHDFDVFEAPCDVNELISLGPDDLAYMIYTSGSTGRPKGVPVHWSALDNHNRWFIKEFDLSATDRCTQLMSVGFDVSIQDIFPALRAGASIFPATKDLLIDPFEFFQWVESNELTVLSFPTALWHTLVPVLSKRPLPPSVRLVLIGGEQVNPQLVKQWFSNVDSDRVRLVNMYGPTEVTIVSTFCELLPDHSCSIGKPIDNIDVHLLDESGSVITEADTIGEIVLSGVGVANNYWNRPEESARSFFRSDFSGQRCYRSGDLARYDSSGRLLFAGRQDNQVKLRGFRIELNEVALAVSLCAGIDDVVVRKAISPAGHEYLACFAVADASTPEAAGALEGRLRDQLSGKLPEYMIPSSIHFVSQFPLTVGGKVDVAKLLDTLRPVKQTVTTGRDPCVGTETERRVCEVWKDVLGYLPASNDATFEQSGGDSLTAVSFVLRLQQEFGLTGVGLATLAIENTISSLAAHVDKLVNQKGADLHQASLTRLPTQGDDLDRPCLILFHPAGGGGYFYNELIDESLQEKFSIVIVDSPLLMGEIPNGPTPTVAQIAQQYYARVAHQLTEGQQIVTAGFSFGGLLAWEFAQLLKREGFQVSKVINIDQPVPAEIRKRDIGTRLGRWLCFRWKHPFTLWQDLERFKAAVVAKSSSQDRCSGLQGHSSSKCVLSHAARLEDYYLGIAREHQPEVDDLEMILIRGEMFLAKFKLPQDYGWSKITNIVRLVNVSGSHSTLFNKRLINELRTAFNDSAKLSSTA